MPSERGRQHWAHPDVVDEGGWLQGDVGLNNWAE